MKFLQGKFNKKEYLSKTRNVMKEAGDICVISIPFAAGALIASALRCHYLCASVSVCTATILLAVISSKRTRCEVPAALLFLSLGIFCYSSCSARGAIPLFNPLHDRLLPLFRDFIYNLPFKKENTAPILCALLTGDKSGMDRNIVSAFRESGAAHILALSGLHLGVIYMLVSKVFAAAGNSIRAAAARSSVTIALCGSYAMATGFSPSITRAFLFIVFNEISKLSPGRRSSPLSTFLTVLTIQLIISPLSISTIGFQLSYLAVLGIVLIYPVLNGMYPQAKRLDIVGKIWSSAALSISCQVTTAPLVWWYFRSLPEYFLLTNLISLPLSEALIVSSVIAIVTGVIFPGAEIPAKLCDSLSDALVFCLETISSM